MSELSETFKKDIALAHFALGRFINYRLSEGLAEQHLLEFKEARSNLEAVLLEEGVHLSVDLPAHEVAESPALMPVLQEVVQT